MVFVNYKKLEIYGVAHDFVLSTYELVKSFPAYEDNNLTSQLRRAATCLPLNIAEGSGARSYKIFLNYLIFCYRSCLECEAALLLAKDLRYVSIEQHDSHHEKLDKFIRMLYGYMKWLESRIGDRKEDKGMWYRHEKWKLQQNVEKTDDSSKRENMGNLC
jgi:four helix bundle protein